MPNTEPTIIEPSLDTKFVAAVDQAISAFRAAGQHLVVHDLAVHMGTDNRRHQGGHSPVTASAVAAMIAPEKRDEFLAKLGALVAGLKPKSASARDTARSVAMHPVS